MRSPYKGGDGEAVGISGAEPNPSDMSGNFCAGINGFWIRPSKIFRYWEAPADSPKAFSPSPCMVLCIPALGQMENRDYESRIRPSKLLLAATGHLKGKIFLLLKNENLFCSLKTSSPI